MEEWRQPRSIFCYSYRPGMLAQHPEDGGFSVNLYDNDILVFTTHGTNRQTLGETAFQLSPVVRLRYLEMVEQAAGWLSAFPAHMSAANPRCASMVGIDGFQLFLLEDMEGLLNCSFRSVRGHNTRMMYNLLEDVSSLLLSQGFDLRPDHFVWSSQVNMLPPQQTAQPLYGA